MALKFASLGSGSKGNGTVIAWDGGCLLVDCGFSAKEAVLRLERVGIEPQRLCGILVTHEHGDHIKGVAALARRYALPVYMTKGTYHAKPMGELPSLSLISGGVDFSIKGLSVHPVSVPHDAQEPVQFVFEYQGVKLGVLTDLGSITAPVEAHYQDLDAMILEANHDSFMLASGPYSTYLKQRVGGIWGHLSNQQAAGFLQRIDCARLQHLVVAHISQQNNSLELAKAALASVCAQVKNVTFACQNQGFDWLTVS